jgi:hypothetical protein
MIQHLASWVSSLHVGSISLFLGWNNFNCISMQLSSRVRNILFQWTLNLGQPGAPSPVVAFAGSYVHYVCVSSDSPRGGVETV